MGKIDTATKELLKNDDVVRDVIRLSMPDVPADDIKLYPMDSDQTATLFDFHKGKGIIAAIERTLDLRRMARWGTDGQFDYLIVGMENQANVNYSMPFRVMFGNMLGYLEQIVSLSDRNRKEDNELREKIRKAGESGQDTAEVLKDSGPQMTFLERMSGLRRTDRLRPVITIVIYWSDEEWDGPLHLQDMIDIPAGLESIVDNNTIHVIQPSMLTDEQLESCKSELGLIFRAIKSDDLVKLAQSDNRYQAINPASANVIEAVTGGIGEVLTQNTVGGTVNMTRTMTAYTERIREEGRQELRDDLEAAKKKASAETDRANAAENRANAAEKKASAETDRANAAEKKASAETDRANAAEKKASAEMDRANAAEEKVDKLERDYQALKEELAMLKRERGSAAGN